MKIERRSISATLRASADAKFELSGLAAVYNVPSADLGGFVETVAPTAFKRALREKQQVYCLKNHNADAVLGTTKNGTLSLADSPEGLRFNCQLNPESESHRDLYASVKRGDLSSCSFAFKVNGPSGEKWESRSGKKFRTLTDVNLFDVSVVTYPAYPGATSVEARSLDYVLSQDIQDMEWESIRARVRAIGAKVLEHRQTKVEDETMLAKIEALGRVVTEDRQRNLRERVQMALLGFEDED